MITNSILNLDFYKLTMMQLAFVHFKNVKVKYKFINRTTKNLLETIDLDVLKSELEHVKTLKLTEEEGVYLKTLKIFSDEFIEFLKDFRWSDLKIEDNNGRVSIESEDDFWVNSILWETIILSTVNELYYRFKYPDQLQMVQFGTQKLLQKYSTLSTREDILFTDFGTRRRFSYNWQKEAVSIMRSLPNFQGTSNVKLAMELGIRPIGTNAHELYMISSGIFNEDLIGSQHKILDLWYDMYGEDLSIALSDTFGTDPFLNYFGEERAKNWKGLRHDSGDPFEFGDKVIEHYEMFGIDPMSKLIVFSDGLTIDKMIRLTDYFKGRINITFGWGTHLTNDMGVETLSIVMKAFVVTSVNGEEKNNFLVKLSDNLNKDMGPDDQVERFKDEFGYNNTDSEDCIV